MHLRFRKLLFLLLLSLSFCTKLSAGWIEEENGKTIINLKLSDLPDPSWNNPATRAECEVIDEFTKKFPEIFARKYKNKYSNHASKYGDYNWDKVEIRLHRFSGLKLQNDGANSAILMAIAGGVAPDIIYVTFSGSDTYIQQGFLYPLDLPQDNYMTSLSKEKIAYRVNPKIRPVIYRKKQGESKKHVWMVPYGGILAKVILYRKDLLRKAKVPFPTQSWTWDDFLDACKKVSNAEKGCYGFLLPQGIPEAYRFNDFIWSAGGQVIEYNKKNKRWEAVFDSREAAVALDFYVNLTSKEWRDRFGVKRWGYTYKDNEANLSKWESGKIGFCSSYLDGKLFSSINPDVVGLVNVPRGPTGISSAQINSRMFGIFSGVKNKVIRDAAWEYLKFISSKKADKIRTKILVESGMGQFVNPEYLRMFGYDNLLRLAPRGWEDIFKSAIKNGQPEPYGKNCQMIYHFMLKPIQEAQQLYNAGNLPENREQRLDVLQGILKKSVIRGNEKMLNLIPREEMQKRRIAAIILIFAIVIGFTILFYTVIKAFTSDQVISSQTSVKKWQFAKYKYAYIIMIPALLSILVWKYLPLLMGLKMAFQDYNIMGNSQWVGVDNFANLLWDRDWWQAMWNSIRYSFLIICLTFLPPLILAVILQEIPKGKLLFRTIFYLPAVITGLVVIYMWKAFYEPNQYGMLNAVIMKVPAVVYVLLGAGIFYIFYLFFRRLWVHNYYLFSVICFIFGICFLVFSLNIVMPILFQQGMPLYKTLFMSFNDPVKWLENPATAMLCCVLPLVWAGMGPGCLIYLAALKGIANDFYEAADIDGATFIDKVLFIVIPILKPLLVIQFIGIFVGAWNNSAYILAMTGGGSNTEVAGLHIFYKAYMYLKFGPATAMAWVLGFLLIGFTVHQLKILSKLEFRTTGKKK